MLLLSILLLPVVMGTDREWNFGKFIVKTNENNTLIDIGRRANGEIYKVNLSNLGLKGIDSHAFNNATKIERLNLANNWLTTLPKYVFSKLSDLNYLSLADNNISSLDRVFIGLLFLQTLDLTNNQLKHIGESHLYGIPTFVTILTKGNVLSNISSLIFAEPHGPQGKTIIINKSNVINNFTNFPIINYNATEVCTDNYWRKWQTTSLSRVYCNVVSVNHTDLRFSPPYVPLFSEMLENGFLNDLPENIVEIDLSGHNIYILRPGMIENPHFRALILDNNNIRQIEDNALGKTNLSVLSLNSNGLQNTEFAKNLPSSLEELYLSHNRIYVITPSSFSGLKNLIKLDLSNNSLTTIEAGSFRMLGALKELNLYGNRVFIYKGIFADLTNIKYLNIAKNALRETKNILFAMPDTLETVILDSNKIVSLEVGSFVRVPKRKLSLRGNNIHNFVEGSFDLPTLKELDLGNNRLANLDRKSFEGLASLKRLSLDGNEITMLKNGNLEFLRQLEILDLSSNPIKNLGRGAFKDMFKLQEGIVFLRDCTIEIIQDPFGH